MTKFKPQAQPVHDFRRSDRQAGRAMIASTQVRSDDVAVGQQCERRTLLHRDEVHRPNGPTDPSIPISLHTDGPAHAGNLHWPYEPSTRHQLEPSVQMALGDQHPVVRRPVGPGHPAGRTGEVANQCRQISVDIAIAGPNQQHLMARSYVQLLQHRGQCGRLVGAQIGPVSQRHVSKAFRRVHMGQINISWNIPKSGSYAVPDSDGHGVRADLLVMLFIA
nr:hypothetical protein [Fodinicola feengrottensis]